MNGTWPQWRAFGTTLLFRSGYPVVDSVGKDRCDMKIWYVERWEKTSGHTQTGPERNILNIPLGPYFKHLFMNEILSYFRILGYLERIDSESWANQVVSGFTLPETKWMFGIRSFDFGARSILRGKLLVSGLFTYQNLHSDDGSFRYDETGWHTNWP